MNMSKVFPISFPCDVFPKLDKSVIFFSLKGMYLLEDSIINKIGIDFSVIYEVQVGGPGLE